MREYLLTLSEKKPLLSDLFEMTFTTDKALEPIVGGQFAQLEVPDRSKVLRRPICIYKYGPFSLTFAIAAVGGGTRSITDLTVGDSIKALLPLGNGFKLEPKHRRVLLLGGGVGCAPLLATTQSYPDREYHSFLSFSNAAKTCFAADFAAKSELTVCTTDGSLGVKGHATDIVGQRISAIKPDVALVCGSRSFMKAAQTLLTEHGVEGYLSYDARMGCGIGACLVCTCRVRGRGADESRRVCVDGPVFSIEEVEL